MRKEKGTIIYEGVLTGLSAENKSKEDKDGFYRIISHKDSNFFTLTKMMLEDCTQTHVRPKSDTSTVARDSYHNKREEYFTGFVPPFYVGKRVRLEQTFQINYRKYRKTIDTRIETLSAEGLPTLVTKSVYKILKKTSTYY